jgi:hypothetical protein
VSGRAGVGGAARGAAWLVLAALALAAGACASAPPASLDAWPPPARPALEFGADTFAFANDIRADNEGKPDLYANYCFVMVRAVVQFKKFARFEPAAPRLDADGYAARVREVVARAPWRDAPPDAERVVIPGYPSLHALSAAEPAAVKAGLGSRLWTLLHWTNWRVGLPVGGAHQARVAREVLAEIDAGRPAQLLVTNLPEWELNHAVVAYGARRPVEGAVALEFLVYDPNDPGTPGVIAFDPVRRAFAVRRLFDTSPGEIRAFRMYHGPLL